MDIPKGTSEGSDLEHGPVSGPSPVRRTLGGWSLSPARARVLEFVRLRHAGVSVDEVADAFGQHPNTVREHLDALAESRWLTRSRTPGPGRGRPAWRYQASPQQPEPDPRVREYAALAEALAGHIASHSSDPHAEARAAGTRWGQALISTDTDTAPISTDTDTALTAGSRGSEGPSDRRRAADPNVVPNAHERVFRLLGDLDFSPLPVVNSCVVLTTCPILDVARIHPDVVCAVHEGMVAGALDALGAPSEGVSLQPFASPHGCLLWLPRPAPV